MRARFAAQAIRKPLRAMQRQLVGVRRNEDSECVHRMRVASRRLRTALALFADVLPAAARRLWRRRLKRTTQALGAARDLDVQIAFLQEYLCRLSTACLRDRPGIEHLLAILTARRTAAQQDVLQALDQLAASRVLAGLAAWAAAQGEPNEHQAGAGELRAEAGRAVRRRLGDLFAYAPYVERPEAVKGLHSMRIAAKRLRYTLEAYAPLCTHALAPQIEWARQLQDWLGEIHDCDVWRVELGRLAGTLAARPSQCRPGGPAPPKLAPGIRHLRRDRAAHRTTIYKELRSAWRYAVATGFWDTFAQPFAGGPAKHQGVRPGRSPAARATRRQARPERAVRGAVTAEQIVTDERLRPVLDLARFHRYEAEHTHQVTRLALDLFAQLSPVHRLGNEQRFWLTSASLLHDIGWIEGRAGHHKTALRLILESPRLPWDKRLRRIVGLVARYHRKALPRDGHEYFQTLSVDDCNAVRKLAALLRIADALDYSHGCIIDKVMCAVTSRRISIRCWAPRTADVECARAVEKGDLAAQVFEREISVTWHRS